MREPASPVGDRILEVSVQPRASRNEILGYRDHLLRIRLTAPPADGVANLLLRRVLAKELGVSPSHVEILRGEKGRRKRIRVTAVPLENLERLEKIREK